ncbi:MAG: polysaccharide biosynthesis tyrosine autokinase [Pseudomonadales bacterium]|jgi:protein-tyrosine kinase|nr:polysaccharide biosynthesis tyrosine autokinase [Pseudomonadales bacterium]MCP5331939.1 polysaccharide biosynthesis tyrosine autokinase [Pseudomonadales bacterium]HMU89717.1 XrtA-associated tyrosine autokinase [Pseudomonadales bacterium]HMW14568.1 XrtA-associated tyrosine autokinase [Pseudomonadales bacterium]HMW83607.1 XrtA-associated tyrosine autokinase [Pseudomonadales bacterium]
MDTIEKAFKKLQERRGEQSEARRRPGSGAVVRLPDEPPHSVTAQAMPEIDPEAQSRPYCEVKSSRYVEIDFDHLREGGLIIPDDERTRLKEEYRHIKRPLLKKVAGLPDKQRNHRNIIMVTSARPGEGKTFNAINLALSIAEERNHRVLLIDADVLKSTVAKKLGVEEGAGLVDYLTGDSDTPGELMYKTNIPQFTLMQAGKRHHLTTELLASKRMEQLVHELATRYADRIIVIDSPPLLSTTEASVLAQLAGQVVLVVAEGLTPQADVKKSLSLMGTSVDVGLILNKSHHASDGYGYYYYGYGQ